MLIIGAGNVGLVTGVCFAEKGHKVICLDIDQKKIKNLNSLIMPIYEPGLERIIRKNFNEKKISFETDYKKSIKNSKILFICVPTPSNEDGSCNLKHIEDVAREIGKTIEDYKIIVTKSTIPVGTTYKLQEIIKNEIDKRKKDIPFDIANNPEFLKEGTAIYDCLNPERIVIGTENIDVKNFLIKLYRDFSDNIVTMDILSSELTKYAANAMLALKVSFINQIANICKNVGANIENVKKGIASDKRIGKYFLNAGIGFGGQCLKKDLRCLSYIAKEANINPILLDAINTVNEEQKIILAKYIEEYFETKDSLENKKFCIWGISFKPNTADIKDAPSIEIINYLQKKGCILNLYDPKAMKNAKEILSEYKNIYWFSNPLEAAKNCDGIILNTEWEEFSKIPLIEIKKVMKQAIIFDGRFFFNPEEAKKIGFNYIGIGIPNNF